MCVCGALCNKCRKCRERQREGKKEKKKGRRSAELGQYFLKTPGENVQRRIAEGKVSRFKFNKKDIFFLGERREGGVVT